MTVMRTGLELLSGEEKNGVQPEGWTPCVKSLEARICGHHFSTSDFYLSLKKAVCDEPSRLLIVTL